MSNQDEGEGAGRSRASDAASTVLGFEKCGATRNASEQEWKKLLKSWHRDSISPGYAPAGARELPPTEYPFRAVSFATAASS